MALNIEAFGASPDSGGDATPAARLALARLRESGARRLVLPPGRLDFWPDRAAERYAFVANNDEGLKRIAFPILDMNGVEIAGEGTRLVFHGRIVPFLVERSRHVRLSGFSIDWQRSFHTEAEILAEHRLGLDLRIPERFPYRIVGGRLVFEGEAGAVHALGNALEWDLVRRETAPHAADNYAIGAHHAAEAIGEHEVRLTARLGRPTPRVGNRLVLVDERRDCPAIVIGGCTDVSIVDVAIHHAGAMGVIAQRSETIRLERVHVTPPPGGERLVSTQNDATHFAHCRGEIALVDCVFENQMDDATNIHGVYAQVTERIRADAVELRLMHRQQHGLEFVAAGEFLQLAHADTLETFAEAGVKAVQRVNKEFFRVTFDRPPAVPPRPGDVATNLSWTADATIRGCTARANRARGFLISTAGRVVVEANRFHVPGAAILIEGDARSWFEAGPVRDVAIRANRFEDCNYGVWGRAAIQIGPAIDAVHQPALRYHANIRIENNAFTAFDARLVHARCVDGLTIRGNTLAASTAYVPGGRGLALDIAHCARVDAEPPAPT